MASPDPVALSKLVLYLPGGVNTAIIQGRDGRAIVVDSGQDRSYGRNVRRALEQLQLAPDAIINTHAHADHFGGNAYLLRHYQVPVYAPEIEASLMRDPYLEPVYLFHGARPPPELTSKWLQAPPSKVDHLLAEGPLELAGLELQVVATPGHAHRHLSILVDDVLIAADAVFGHSVLDRYPVPFGQDIGAQLASLELVAALEVGVLLPGHGEPSRDPAELIAANRAAVERVSAAVLARCSRSTTEEVLAGTCRDVGSVASDLARYHLLYCTISAHLSYLRELGRVEAALQDNRLIWYRP